MKEARGWSWQQYRDALAPFAHYWRAVSKTDPRAAALADRHYSRHKIGSREIGPPGQKLVLLTAEEDALWGSHRPAPWTEAKRMDDFLGHCCFIFRNEGAGLSSNLIREAILLTCVVWGLADWITYVAVEKVRSTNPGYCFLQAGFQRVGFRDDTKHGCMARLELPLDAILGWLD